MKPLRLLLVLACISFSCNLVAGDGAFDNLTSTNLTVTGQSSLNSVNSAAITSSSRITINSPTSPTQPSLKTSNGAVVFLGSSTLSSGGSIPVEGTGVRMMWYPKKAAFRAGKAENTDWNDNQIGTYSVAFGRYSTASGENSFAGPISIVYATSATAFGGGQAYGSYSFAAGGVTFGSSSFAVDNGMTFGDASFAAGGGIANAYRSVVIGQFNEASPLSSSGATAWDPSDELFVIGNGYQAEEPSNALVVYKNGVIKIPKRQGDILMGEFGAGNGD